MGDVKFNSSGGGSVTLTPPSTASNLTVTLPSTSGTLLNTGATSFTFAGAGTISATTTLTLNGGAGSNGLVLDASNNVGIGTGSPASKLDVAGEIRIYPSSGTGNLRFGSGGVEKGKLLVDSSSNMGFETAGTQRMTLDSSGNLGLGVTPSGWATLKAFSVGGTGSSISGNTNGLYLTQSAYYNAGWKYSQSSNPAALYQQVDNVHSWHIAASGTAGNAITFTQAMTLDASGNLLVGQTARGGQNLNSFDFDIQAAVIYQSHVSGVTSGSAYTTFNYASTQIGSITQNGTTGVLYNITSDQRLKENIVDAPNALSSINAIKVRSFDWKADGSHSEYGYIAQELLEVAPEAVHVPTDPDEMMGVDFGKLTPRIIKALQELSAKNSELESRLAALEGK